MSPHGILLFCGRLHNELMNNNANNNPATNNRRYYSKVEYDSATDFARFLFDIWRTRLKDEIMKVDKTIYDNEEPTYVN